MRRQAGYRGRNRSLLPLLVLLRLFPAPPIVIQNPSLLTLPTSVLALVQPPTLLAVHPKNARSRA